MHPFQAVHHTIHEVLQTDQTLPPFFQGAIDFLSQAHIYYRSYIHVGIYENAAQHPNQGHPAIYGAALQLIGNFTTMGAYAINVALVTKCTLDLLREYRQLGQNYQTLRQTICGQYPLYQSVKWSQAERTSQEILTPSLTLSWRIYIMRFSQQIVRISHCALDVFKQMFKLSMCVCDAYLLLDDNPQMRYEACTELVAKWSDYQKEIQENQERIIEEIEKGSVLADRILDRLGVEKNSALIISQLRKDLAAKTHTLREDIQNAAEGTLDSVFAIGKITPLRFHMPESKAAIPDSSEGCFVPWTGQEVFIASSSQTSKKPKKHLVTFADTVAHSIQSIMGIGKQVPSNPTRSKDTSLSPFD